MCWVKTVLNSQFSVDGHSAPEPENRLLSCPLQLRGVLLSSLPHVPIDEDERYINARPILVDRHPRIWREYLCLEFRLAERTVKLWMWPPVERRKGNGIET